MIHLDLRTGVVSCVDADYVPPPHSIRVSDKDLPTGMEVVLRRRDGLVVEVLDAESGSRSGPLRWLERLGFRRTGSGTIRLDRPDGVVMVAVPDFGICPVDRIVEEVDGPLAVVSTDPMGTFVLYRDPVVRRLMRLRPDVAFVWATNDFPYDGKYGTVVWNTDPFGPSGPPSHVFVQLASRFVCMMGHGRNS